MTSHDQAADLRTRAWVVIAALFLSLFVTYGAAGMTLPALFMPLLKHFRVNRAAISMLIGLEGMAAAVSAPVAGWLLDRIEAPSVMAAGTIVTAAALLMASRADSFAGLAIAYGVMGLGLSAAALVSCPFVAANWFPDKGKGLALGFTMLGLSAGGMVMNLAAWYLTAWFGWRACFAVLATVVIVVMLPIIMLVVRSRPPPLAETERAREISPVSAELPGLDLNQAFGERSIWLICAVQFLYSFTLFGTFVHLTPYLIGDGYTAMAATFVLSTQIGLAGAGKLGMGWVADRITARWALLINTAVNAISYILLFHARSAPMLAFFVLFYGCTTAAPLALVPMLISESLGLKRFGSFIGLSTIFAQVGGAIGPVAAGWIFDRNHSYSAAIILFIAFQAFCG
ncbi:MAG: MFS transporter, partial [Candidatus Binataceae bacterium]